MILAYITQTGLNDAFVVKYWIDLHLVFQSVFVLKHVMCFIQVSYLNLCNIIHVMFKVRLTTSKMCDAVYVGFCVI